MPAGGEFDHHNIGDDDHHDFDLGSLMVPFLVIYGDVCYFFGSYDQNDCISGM